MSTAVGLVHNGNIYLGTDGRATTEDSDMRPMKLKKIFRNDDYLIAFIGSVRAGQTLYPHSFTPPESIYDFPDFLRCQFEQKGCLGKDDQQMDTMTSNFLVAHDGKLYEILIDFQMNEIEEFVSVGAGCSYSFGAYYAAKNFVDDPEELVKLTLKAAAEFNALTGPPFQIEML